MELQLEYGHYYFSLKIYIIYLLQNQKAKFYFIRGIGTMKIINYKYLLFLTKFVYKIYFWNVKKTKFLYPEERGDHCFQKTG